MSGPLDTAMAPIFWAVLSVMALALLLHCREAWREWRHFQALAAQLDRLRARGGGPWPQLERLRVRQRLRSYYLFRPAVSSRARLPLVLAFHGGGGNGNGLAFARMTRWNHLGAREGVMIAYPNARAYWNDGRRGTAMQGNDLAFVNALIDRLVEQEGADPRKIYATGISNGGIFVLRLACECPRIAAFASVLAAMPEDLAPRCRPTRPLPILMINGTDDRLIPWKGGTIPSSRGVGRGGRLLSVERTLAFWRRHNHCRAAARITELATPAGDADPLPAHRIEYASCAPGGTVQMIRIEGGGHHWPGAIARPRNKPRARLAGRASMLDATALIWEFFSHWQLPPEGEGKS